MVSYPTILTTPLSLFLVRSKQTDSFTRRDVVDVTSQQMLFALPDRLQETSVILICNDEHIQRQIWNCTNFNLRINKLNKLINKFCLILSQVSNFTCSLIFPAQQMFSTNTTCRTSNFYHVLKSLDILGGRIGFLVKM